MRAYGEVDDVIVPGGVGDGGNGSAYDSDHRVGKVLSVARDVAEDVGIGLWFLCRCCGFRGSGPQRGAKHYQGGNNACDE